MDIRKLDSGLNIKKYEDKIKENGIAKKNFKQGKSDNLSIETADKISISGAAKKSSITDIAVNKIKSDSQKEFSIEKFNALKEKIKNNEYNVPANKIAQAILAGVNND